MGNIQDIIRIFSANILLAAKEDLSVKILAETLIINGLGGHQPIKEMTINFVGHRKRSGKKSNRYPK